MTRQTAKAGWLYGAFFAAGLAAGVVFGIADSPKLDRLIDEHLAIACLVAGTGSVLLSVYMVAVAAVMNVLTNWVWRKV